MGLGSACYRRRTGNPCSGNERYGQRLIAVKKVELAVKDIAAQIMIRTNKNFNSAPRSAAADYRFSSLVNSTGTLTCETVPGLNFQVRSVLRTDLSKSAFPVLCAIEASVTLPLAGSTDTTQTPLPAIRWERASCG